MKKYFINKTDYSNDEFVLDKNNSNSYDFSKISRFSNFNEFLKACQYDLSDANLYNIPNNIKISDNEKKRIKYNKFTILPDYIWKQIGVEIPKIIYNSFQPTELFVETKVNNNKISTITIPFEYNELGEIDYISDLHLDSKIPQNATMYEATLIIVQLLNNIYESYNSDIQVFAGDICHNKLLYQLFINILSKFHGKKIIILGNHEFWDFRSIKEAKGFYKKIIEKQKDMIFLHNELLCIDLRNKILKKFTKIPEKKLLSWDDKDEKKFNKNFDSYQYYILGGCGFSGLNLFFNAKHGLYGRCLDYNTDKIESAKFDAIFNKVSLLSKNKSLIVVSHTPYTNWHRGALPNIDTNIFYINGHTHRNIYLRIDNNFIYSDNQIGYKFDIKKTRFKSIQFKENFDYFYQFTDGIKEINYKEYLNFLQGKRIQIDLTPNKNFKLYLVRKNGYSMFIRESKTGNLCLMYKGQAKILPKRPIQYYYDNIELSIDKIRLPLKKFNHFLKQISKEIKSFGGTGYIHGQIIDIDFYSHLYINPIDKQITPYYAVDIIDKTVYPNISLLLKDKNKLLYAKYKKFTNSNALSILNNCKLPDIKKPTKYLETDIYKTNSHLHKLDLSVYEKIIGLWVEPEQDFYKITDNKLLTNKKK